MLYSAIITLAEKHSLERYDNSDWAELINKCLDELTPLAKVSKRKTDISIIVTSGAVTIDVSADADLAKAHEFLNVYAKVGTATTYTKLKRLAVDDEVSKGWKVIGEDIYLQGLGTAGATDKAQVDYYQKLTNVTVSTLSTEPEFPSEYHHIVFEYMVAMSADREFRQTSDHYVLYLRNKDAFALDRIWMMEPENRGAIEAIRLANKLGADRQNKIYL